MYRAEKGLSNDRKRISLSSFGKRTKQGAEREKRKERKDDIIRSRNRKKKEWKVDNEGSGKRTKQGADRGQ